MGAVSSSTGHMRKKSVMSKKRTVVKIANIDNPVSHIESLLHVLVGLGAVSDAKNLTPVTTEGLALDRKESERRSENETNHMKGGALGFQPGTASPNTDEKKHGHLHQEKRF